MSQFDFPRINFSGSAALDTATANNGNYGPPLTLFDQDESMAFIPPRCYIGSDPTKCPQEYASQLLEDKYQQYYVPISPITTENYQDWASTPLGNFSADQSYINLYNFLGIFQSTPGYWNYFGDLSVTLNDVVVKGITIPDSTLGSKTFTPQNPQGCPPGLSDMLNAELSFNSDYFMPDSRTTAFMCDTDSVGQMCTQIFASRVGLYSNNGGENKTFFSGTPVKSTARWMNLNRVLNYTNMIPMGGAASFYSMIQLDPGSEVASIFSQYTGGPVTCLFMKIMIHEVYEVRNPNYDLTPKKKVRSASGSTVELSKNPALVSITGSITPWKIGDLRTAPLARILKSSQAITIDPTNIPVPNPKDKAPLKIPASVTMGPMFISQDIEGGLLSVDILNAINEYGSNPGGFPTHGGSGDIPPYRTFESYNYGKFSLAYHPDGQGPPSPITDINFSDYSLAQLKATGGMMDIKVPPGTDYSHGYFILLLNGQTVLKEDDVFITTDQQGIYAEQNQAQVGVYMSDGLPLVPFKLKVLKRGVPVAQANAVPATLQSINVNTNVVNNASITIYDGMTYQFPIDQDGCFTYAFVYDQSELMPNNFGLPDLFAFTKRAYMNVIRVLSEEPQLDIYIKGGQPVTWQVVYDNVFQLYKTLFPIMDAIVPLNEANWSEPFMQQKMIQLISVENWNAPMYMPVTRDLSAAQRQLLVLWVNQSQQLKA
ncbi:MAG: hypothetical protein K0S44_591 [Bacteroidetes bacterium]|jgi:hypothetical protein|nr:hypothetical protein [Bacteroidota bacterium]